MDELEFNKQAARTDRARQIKSILACLASIGAKGHDDVDSMANAIGKMSHEDLLTWAATIKRTLQEEYKSL